MNQIKTSYANNGELLDTIETLQKSFENVRCVNLILMKCIEFHRDGTHDETDYKDYSTMEKGNVGEGAMPDFVNNDTYYVISKFITLEGYDLPLTLEIVSRFSDSLSLDRFGNDLLIERISKDNADLYMDTETGLFNQEYLNDKLDMLNEKALKLSLPITVTVFSIDDYQKTLKKAGKVRERDILRTIGLLIQSNISRRRGDFAAYLGNGYFAAVLLGMPSIVLESRFKVIAQRTSEIPFNFKLSLSAGGVCAKGMTIADDLFKIAEGNMLTARQGDMGGYLITDLTTPEPVKITGA